jgi:putative flippase GtrA
LKQFTGFLVVGSLGFVIDAAILSALVHGWGWSHYSARALSFAAAVTATWYCNRQWVFRRTADASREYGTYFGLQFLGAMINLGTYVLILETAQSLTRLPVVPLAGGAALALLFNFWAARRWAFGTPQPVDRNHRA